ncbi:MAG TPA: hypothetical protein VN420_02830 [Candidatus Fimivivens sp.]|nr:hypothetical protein [Candidatus Fimivivens sp.]
MTALTATTAKPVRITQAFTNQRDIFDGLQTETLDIVGIGIIDEKKSIAAQNDGRFVVVIIPPHVAVPEYFLFDPETYRLTVKQEAGTVTFAITYTESKDVVCSYTTSLSEATKNAHVLSKTPDYPVLPASYELLIAGVSVNGLCFAVVKTQEDRLITLSLPNGISQESSFLEACSDPRTAHYTVYISDKKIGLRWFGVV